MSYLVDFESLFDNRKYDEAYLIYKKHLLTKEDKQHVESFIQSKIDNFLENYLYNKIHLEDMERLLKVIKKYNFTYDTQVMKTFTRYKNSKDNFKLAESFEAKNDYVHAIDFYTKVIKGDSNYLVALTSIERSLDFVRLQILKKVDELFSKGYKTAAIKLLKKEITKYSFTNIVYDLKNQLDYYSNQL